MKLDAFMKRDLLNKVGLKCLLCARHYDGGCERGHGEHSARDLEYSCCLLLLSQVDPVEPVPVHFLPLISHP